MGEWVTKILALREVALKPLVAVMIVTGVPLFVPGAWLTQLRLDRLIELYGQWIGMSFLASTALAVIEVTARISGSMRSRRRRSGAERYTLSTIATLDPEEQAVLREFFITQQNTIDMPVDYPVVAGLLNKGLLEQVSNTGRGGLAGLVFPLTITELVRPHLTAAALGVPSGMSDTHRNDWLLEHRPAFVATVARLHSIRYGRW